MRQCMIMARWRKKGIGNWAYAFIHYWLLGRIGDRISQTLSLETGKLSWDLFQFWSTYCFWHPSNPSASSIKQHSPFRILVLVEREAATSHQHTLKRKNLCYSTLVNCNTNADNLFVLSVLVCNAQRVQKAYAFVLVKYHTCFFRLKAGMLERNSRKQL